MSLENKSILLVVTGGIAAYKSLELVRLLKKEKAKIVAILTQAGSRFITPLSLSSLTGTKTYDDLWSLTDEAEMGHIRLGRSHDLIIVAPASADFIAKLANGLANDLATTTLLASESPIILVPAMNPSMWSNPATQSNVKILLERGIVCIGPEAGEMACGETGLGRMTEPESILASIQSFLLKGPLSGVRALVTSGPTHEPIDPVRYIGNRSSGKQGHAIARALHSAGARVTLITGPVSLSDPVGMHVIHVQTALEMFNATLECLPQDIFVCAAAVSDWKPTVYHDQKIKKNSSPDNPSLTFTENPDILFNVSTHKTKRPKLVIGFAAETNNVLPNARKKLKIKKCDWIVANAVGPDENGLERAFQRDINSVHLLTAKNQIDWPDISKTEIASRLVQHIKAFWTEK